MVVHLTMAVISVCRGQCGLETLASSTFTTKAEFRFSNFLSFGGRRKWEKDGEAEMFKLLCGLTPLPLAKLSSITPDAGPSCLKPRVSAHSPKRFPGGRAGRMREAILRPTAWPHAACRRVCCHQVSDPCAGRYCCPQPQC